MMHERGKSDPEVVAEKPTNKAEQSAAESVEPRAGTEGNADQQNTRRAQDRISVSQALDRIRQAARERRKERFTALFHHINIELLEAAFYEVNADAAAGVDGVTLAREPGLRRILGDVEVNDPSSIMAEEDQGVEKPKRRSCYDEHVDRDNVGHVVLQKGAPGRGGDFGTPWHVPPDRGLADFNTKLEQFTVNSRRSPKRVGHAHLADQITGLGAHLGPAHGA